MIKDDFKKLWKPFVFIFLALCVVINWDHVSWLFNYTAVSRVAGTVFHKDVQITNNQKFEYTDKENSIEIPKIETSVPLVFPVGSSTKDISQALNVGTVHFPNSALPGESGQTIILGHSAPANWPKIKYDWVFSKLNDLEAGDEIFVYFQYKKIKYAVFKKIFLEKGEDVPVLTNSENTLVLISCWPPGKDIRRIAVEAAMEQ
ncbi:MAG: sortase [Candidatus Pacebacteria bacterium]|nr:sortase [Candidatus Paceibacterota bacterium]